jgi:preprotein translocase subunit SecE
MATQAVKVKNEGSEGGSGEAIRNAVTGRLAGTREFLHEVRVEAQKVTWPSKEDVISTTGVVIATVAFFAVFLRLVDWIVEKGVTQLFKAFGV